MSFFVFLFRAKRLAEAWCWHHILHSFFNTSMIVRFRRVAEQCHDDFTADMKFFLIKHTFSLLQLWSSCSILACLLHGVNGVDTCSARARPRPSRPRARTCSAHVSTIIHDVKVPVAMRCKGQIRTRGDAFEIHHSSNPAVKVLFHRFSAGPRRTSTFVF